MKIKITIMDGTPEELAAFKEKQPVPRAEIEAIIAEAISNVLVYDDNPNRVSDVLQAYWSSQKASRHTK